MKAFEKVAIVIGFLVVVGVVVTIRLKLPWGEGPGQKSPESSGGVATTRGAPGRLPVRLGGERTRPGRPETHPGEGRPVADVDRSDTVLARVNGMPITEWQVFGPRGLSDEMMERAGAQYPRRMLDAAIDQELMRQYGAEQKLDQTEEYREMKGYQERMARQMEVNRLAGYYESRSEELTALRESLKASPDEVEEYYREHAKRYDRLGEDRAKTSIERMLSMQKYNQAYKGWLAGTLESVSVTVNGQEVPLDLLIQGMDELFPARRERGVRPPSSALQGSALAEYIRTVAGATDDSEESRQRLLDARIAVGPDTIRLGDLFPQPPGGAARGPEGGRPGIPIDQMLRGPMLMASIKGYIVAERARQEGVHETEEFKAQMSMGPPAYMPGGGDVLPRLVMEHEGLLSPGDLENEVTDEEIDAHIAANPKRYERIAARSPARARSIAKRRMAYEKLREKKEDFLAGLRKNAVIEIVDERFKGEASGEPYDAPLPAGFPDYRYR